MPKPIHKINLTKATVENAAYPADLLHSNDATPPKRRFILWDAKVNGLGLQVFPPVEHAGERTPHSKKSFVLRYRINRREQYMVLGHFPELSVDAARNAARAHLGKIAMGVDPREEVRAKVEAARQARLAADAEANELTFDQLADLYVEKHAKKKRDFRNDESYLKNNLRPALGTRKANAIRKPDIRSIFNSLSQTSPIAANRLLSLVSKVFNFAIDHGYLPEDFPNPARGIKRNPSNARSRRLTTDELKRLWKVLDEGRVVIKVTARKNRKDKSKETEDRTVTINPFIVEYVRLSILTGLRCRELLQLTWDRVDDKSQTLRIPAEHAKNRREHLLPFGKHALLIFNRLADLRHKDSKWVFPGTDPKDPIQDPKRGWHEIREAAKITDVTIHDLRRSFASFAVDAGVDIAVIAVLLNQTLPTVTATYARPSEQTLRRAVEAVEKHVLDLVSGGKNRKRQKRTGE